MTCRRCHLATQHGFTRFRLLSRPPSTINLTRPRRKNRVNNVNIIIINSDDTRGSATPIIAATATTPSPSSYLALRETLAHNPSSTTIEPAFRRIFPKLDSTIPPVSSTLTSTCTRTPYGPHLNNTYTYTSTTNHRIPHAVSPISSRHSVQSRSRTWPLCSPTPSSSSSTTHRRSSPRPPSHQTPTIPFLRPLPPLPSSSSLSSSPSSSYLRLISTQTRTSNHTRPISFHLHPGRPQQSQSQPQPQPTPNPTSSSSRSSVLGPSTPTSLFDLDIRRIRVRRSGSFVRENMSSSGVMQRKGYSTRSGQKGPSSSSEGGEPMGRVSTGPTHSVDPTSPSTSSSLSPSSSHAHAHDHKAHTHSHGLFGGGHHHHDHSEGAGEIIAALTGTKKDKGSRITLIGECGGLVVGFAFA